MIRGQIHEICDRCAKAYGLKQFDVSDGLPDVEKRSPIEVRVGDEVVARFEDLCEDCDRVVDKLLSKLVLESSKKKKQGGETTQNDQSTSSETIRNCSTETGDSAPGQNECTSGEGGPESNGSDHTKEGGAAEDAAPADTGTTPAGGDTAARTETKTSEQHDGHDF
jgi:hypothetical protein